MSASTAPSVLGGRYRLVGLLGRGGAAEVHRARDEVLHREVAVKILPGGGSAEEVQRMEAEMRTLARLSHPALVGVHDAGADEGRPWFVMELVEGMTLSDRLRDGPLPLPQVRRLGLRLADALGVAHDSGVVHRDLKPGNVLLPAGEVEGAKLADFGVARVLDAAPLTTTGLVVGTAAYLAPEQVTGEGVTPAADVWTLGLVLLECVTGEREYAGTGIAAAAARLHRAPRVPDDLPPRLQHLLAWTLRDEPHRRPSTAEVARRLRDPDLLSPDPPPAPHGRPDAAATEVLRRDEEGATTSLASTGRNVSPRPTTSENRTQALPADADDQPAPGSTGRTASPGRRMDQRPRRTAPARPRPTSPPSRGGGLGVRALVVAVALLVVLVVVLVLALLQTSGADIGPPLQEPLRQLEQEVGLR